MVDSIDNMEWLLGGHILEIADDKATELEWSISGQDEDPTVFDNIDEGLEED